MSVGLASRLLPPPKTSHPSNRPSPRRHHSVGHTGKFGHEFMEFEVQSRDGRLRYANNSSYKGAKMIRKQGKEVWELL